MSGFRDHAAVYGPDELAVFQEAFDHACRKLGLDPSPTDDTPNVCATISPQR